MSTGSSLECKYEFHKTRVGKDFDQGVTTCWKSVHRISGYQGYQPDISGTINGYQEKIDRISIKYLTDFSRIFLKNLMDIPKLAARYQWTVVREYKT